MPASTARVDARVQDNPALTIDRDKGDYHLARLKTNSAHDAAQGLSDLLESRMPEVELIDALIDVDNATNFLHHFLQSSSDRRLPPAIQRRNLLAALVAVGCNIGPTRMAPFLHYEEHVAAIRDSLGTSAVAELSKPSAPGIRPGVSQMSGRRRRAKAPREPIYLKARMPPDRQLK